jgi:hypothetical protein
VDEGRCPLDGEHELAGVGGRAPGLGDAGVSPQPSSGIDVDRKGAS